MPRRPDTPCNKAGCPRLKPVREMYCTEHKRQERRQYDKERGTAAERGYGKRWREIRKAFLNENPLCVMCEAEGRTAAAAVVHHRDGDQANNLEENLQALCREHHEKHHAKERWG